MPAVDATTPSMTARRTALGVAIASVLAACTPRDDDDDASTDSEPASTEASRSRLLRCE